MVNIALMSLFVTFVHTFRFRKKKIGEKTSITRNFREIILYKKNGCNKCSQMQHKNSKLNWRKSLKEWNFALNIRCVLYIKK